jgi:hypothetical protein
MYSVVISNAEGSITSAPATLTVTYRLDTIPTAGVITLQPPGGHYLPNSVVTSFATAGAGSPFLQWLGDAGGSNPTNAIVMTGNKTIQAIFGLPVKVTAGPGGSVVVDPALDFYPWWSSFRVTGIPLPGNFLLWNNVQAGQSSWLFPVDGRSADLAASFAPLTAGQYALTIVVKGDGSVEVSPQATVFTAGEAMRRETPTR